MMEAINVNTMKCVQMPYVTYLRINMHTAHKIPPAPAANPTTPIITYTTMESKREKHIFHFLANFCPFSGLRSHTMELFWGIDLAVDGLHSMSRDWNEWGLLAKLNDKQKKLVRNVLFTSSNIPRQRKKFCRR